MWQENGLLLTFFFFSSEKKDQINQLSLVYSIEDTTTGPTDVYLEKRASTMDFFVSVKPDRKLN